MKTISMVAATLLVLSLGHEARAVPWFSDSFDNYTNGALYGQGGWTGDSGPVRIQTDFVKSVKSAEVNYKLWGLNDSTPEQVEHSVNSGVAIHIIDVDVAMDSETTQPVGTDLGYIKFANSSDTDIAIIYLSHRQIRTFFSEGQVVIADNVQNRQWRHVRLAMNLSVGTMEAFVDGVFRASGGMPTAGSAITKIEIGQWNQGTAFTKAETYVDNLVCTAGAYPILATYSQWERRHVAYPFVFFDSSADQYKMYYSGAGGSDVNESAWSPWRTGVCASIDGSYFWRINENFEPVLMGMKFMEGDLLNASTMSAVFDSVHAYQPCVVKDGSTYKMWYTGWNGDSEHVGGGVTRKFNYRIGYATSSDGIHWAKHQGSGAGGSVLGVGPRGTPDAKGAGRPFVIKEGSTYRMWYEGLDLIGWRICYATSADGINWTKQGLALDRGAAGAFDELEVRNPVVIVRNGQYELWYRGRGGTSPNYHVLRATSPTGASWTRIATEVGLHPYDSVDGAEIVQVDSAITKPDGTVQVYYTKENTTTSPVTYGTVSNKTRRIYTEVVTP